MGGVAGDDRSDLAEAADVDELEGEDEEHFPDDGGAYAPEVLPIGASRPVELP